jgi:quercetin dioxygenase-like cupin family protein
MTGEASTREARAVVLGPGEGRQIPNTSGGTFTFKATGSETGGSLLVLESVIAPGEGPPLHVHAAMDEVIYVLEGQLRVRLGPALHQASAGACVSIPRGTVHTWQTVGADPARFLAVATPAGRGCRRLAHRGPGDTLRASSAAEPGRRGAATLVS